MRFNLQSLVLIILASIYQSCSYFELGRYSNWEDFEKETQVDLFIGKEKLYKNKSSINLEDIKKRFGNPIDSINYIEKFKKDTIHYTGLLGRDVISINTYDRYSKKVSPIIEKLYNKYLYQSEPYKYELQDAYYDEVKKYQYTYNESRHDRLSRIKKLIPTWNQKYIDESDYKEFYDHGEDGLNLDIIYHNCIEYQFLLADKVTKQSIYGKPTNGDDPNESISVFGSVYVDSNYMLVATNSFYRVDADKYSALRKNDTKRNMALLFIFICIVILFYIYSKWNFRKKQQQNLLLLEQSLSDVREYRINEGRIKFYSIQHTYLKGTNSEEKITEIQERLKLTLNCTICNKPTFVKESIMIEDQDTSKYMSHGRYNKDGSLDKRFNTEFNYSTTYYYKATCEHCSRVFKFSDTKKLI